MGTVNDSCYLKVAVCPLVISRYLSTCAHICLEMRLNYLRGRPRIVIGVSLWNLKEK